MTNRLLPPFPVDDSTLDLVMRAINPPPDEQTGMAQSSVFKLLEFYSAMAGSDLDAIIEEESTEYVRTMRDPQYCEYDVIESAIDEIRRLRAELAVR